MIEKPSEDDLRADAAREWRRWDTWVGTLASVILILPIIFLLDRDSSESWRTFWLFFPWPFLALALWSWTASDRRRDEFQRSIDRDASFIGMRLVIFWVLAMAYLEASGQTIAWRDAILFPFVFYAFGLIRAHRRVKLP
jgi:hypothetical protein